MVDIKYLFVIMTVTTIVGVGVEEFHSSLPTSLSAAVIIVRRDYQSIYMSVLFFCLVCRFCTIHTRSMFVCLSVSVSVLSH